MVQPQTPIRVRFQGIVVYEWNWGRDGLSLATDQQGLFASQGSDKDEYVVAAGFQVEALTPDGWESVPFQSSACNEQFSQEDPVWWRVRIALKDAGRPHLKLFVDNREHDAIILLCGNLELRVSANATAEFSFPTPRRAENTAILWKGETIGRVAYGGQPDGDLSAYFKSYLVDTSGKRSYIAKAVTYGDVPDFASPREKKYPPAVFREVISIDHFLHSPEIVFSEGHTIKRSVLYEDDLRD